MSAQGEPDPEDQRAVRFRWIARAVVAAIGLWVLAEGLRGVWSEADALGQVVVVGAVLLVVGVAVLVFVSLDRRGR